MRSNSVVKLLLLAILLCSALSRASILEGSSVPKMLSLEEFIRSTVASHDGESDWKFAVKVAFVGPNYAETKEVFSLVTGEHEKTSVNKIVGKGLFTYAVSPSSHTSDVLRTLASSDYVVLLASAVQQEYDSSINAVGGINELLISITGFELKMSAFVLTKIDDPSVKDPQQAYLNIKANLVKRFKAIPGAVRVPFVPVNLHGKDNILVPSKSMGWYTDGALSDTIVKTAMELKHDKREEMRFSVSRVHKEPKVGVIATGRLRGTSIKSSLQNLITCHPRLTTEVKFIKVNGMTRDSLNNGETGELNLKNLQGTKSEIDEGSVLAFANSEDCKPVSGFTAKIFLDQSTSSTMRKYSVYTFHVDQQIFKGEIAELSSTFDTRTLKTLETNVKSFNAGPGTGLVAEINITGDKYPVLDHPKTYPTLGKGVITNDEERIIGYFTITQTRNNIASKP